MEASWTQPYSVPSPTQAPSPASSPSCGAAFAAGGFTDRSMSASSATSKRTATSGANKPYAMAPLPRRQPKSQRDNVMRDLLERLMLMLHGERRQTVRVDEARSAVILQQRRVAGRLARLVGGTPDEVLRDAARRSQQRVAR